MAKRHKKHRSKKRRKDAIPPGPKVASLAAIKKGLTLSQISKKTGITTSHLSYIFNGKVSPRLLTAKKIAKCLEMNLDDLYNSLPKPA